MYSRAFFAPQAEGILNHLIGDFFVALADHDVDRRLAADELRERRDHDRVTELGAHLDDFFEHVWHLVFFAEHLELMAQVGNHAAGNLVAIPGLVVFARRADGQTFFLCDPAKVLFHRFEQLFH